MCFAPQRRALFRHVNFQKRSDTQVLCTFWLGNLLRTDGVHFFDISTSKSSPRIVCFVHFDFDMCFAPQRRAIFHLSSGQMAPHPPLLASLLFDPPEPQIIGKTCDFSTFLRACICSFFWLFLVSDLLSSSLLFSSLLFSSLPFPSLRFASLRFASLRFASLLFSSLPFPSLPFPSLPFPSLPFPSLRFASLRFASLLFSSLLWLFPPLLFHLSTLSEVWLLNFLRETVPNFFLQWLQWPLIL